MKRDIDALLSERNLAAAVLIQGEVPSPSFRYVTGVDGHLLGVLVLRPGRTPFLVHGAMERDTAAKTGFELVDYGTLGYRAMLEEEEGSANRATARLIAAVLERLEVRGRVLVGGIDDVGRYYHVLRGLAERAPGIELVEDEQQGLFITARSTKDGAEIEAVRAVGAVCDRAYGRIRSILNGGRLEGTKLRDREGWVTIGRLRREVRRLFFEEGLAEPHGNIIAMGRDAGVPHNAGNDADVVEEGRPIVIDLYPAQAGGGYYFDITRTYCVGRAPERLREIHAHVREAVERVLDALASGSPARIYQDLVCQFFESKGHRTIRQDERLTEGYIHGLGHGIGLEVHERPNLGGTSHNRDLILPGALFTVEPGLYYPSQGLGVRLEDVVYVREDGTFENLTHVPYDLEVEPALAV
jgi:Xaa-Pro aminopeptidase